MAVIPDPEARWRVDLAKARWAKSGEPIMEGCPCPACRAEYTRGYVHYLVKNREPTGSRLLTIHNLAYLSRLMAGLRAAVSEGRLAAHAAALRAGAAP
jgi:queuine tRNA-ribosyltransferase